MTKYIKIEACGKCPNSRQKGDGYWYCNPPGKTPWKTVLDGKPILPETIPIYCPLDTKASICNEFKPTKPMTYKYDRCEYETTWEIKGNSASTSGENGLNYQYSSCSMVVCPYPDKVCGLHRPGESPCVRHQE